MKKSVSGTKVETESLKKTQTEGKWEMKNSETQTRSSEACLTNRIKRWKRASQALETRWKKLILWSKKMSSLLKNLGSKYPGNLFNKIIEEKKNSNLKKEMPIMVQEADKTQIRREQKRKYP